MKLPENHLRSFVERPGRRTFLKGAVGTAATAAAIPALSTIASAHFPNTLKIDIEPDSEQNRIDPNSDGTVSVAVLQTTFVDEDGKETTFDPTTRPRRYRFGTNLLTEAGEARDPESGARPVDDGHVEDVNGDENDDLVLRFPIEDAGFSAGDTTGTLLWQRPGTNEHGLHGTDGVVVIGQRSPTDVEILNYALTLEHLEAAYYNDFLDDYSESEVERSAVANYFARPTLQYSIYQQIEDVRDHEEAHVEKLTETINHLGGDPVGPAEYEFPYSSIEEFVAVADRLEAVGVSAYAGAAPLISNPDLIPPALSIHSVEANHSTFFNVLHLQRAVPNAFNPARSMDQVLPIAKQFMDHH